MAKTIFLANTFKTSDTVEFGLTVLAITWRNRLVHADAENELPEGIEELLEGAADAVAEHYQGLDIGVTLEDFAPGVAPKFKEVTALVRATHGFVEAVDLEGLATPPADVHGRCSGGLRRYRQAPPDRKHLG